MLRDPGFKIWDRDLNQILREARSHPETRFRDPSQTLLRSSWSGQTVFPRPTFSGFRLCRPDEQSAYTGCFNLTGRKNGFDNICLKYKSKTNLMSDLSTQQMSQMWDKSVITFVSKKCGTNVFQISHYICPCRSKNSLSLTFH